MPKHEVSPDTVYSGQFFDMIEQGSVQSASVVVPTLLSLIQPDRVADVGCGRGAWLRVFQEHGVHEVRGFDGTYVEKDKLLIDPGSFYAEDFTESFEIREKFDLAICLEVLEHVPDPVGRAIVRQLTRCAPLVLFSAAIPGQFGQNHVNAQWLSYWQALFAEQGFEYLDPIRRRVRDDQRVEWWYRQNMVLYASPKAVEASPALRAEREFATEPILEWVHHNVLMHSLVEANSWKTKFGIRQLLHLIGE